MSPAHARGVSGNEVDAFVGLGANLGDAASAIERALEALAEVPDTLLVARSPVYVSAPVDAEGPDFFNAVAHVRTRQSPDELLDRLQAIEAGAGRTRLRRNAPRTLDLDLLFYADVVRHDPVLTLPHPRWRQRAFVLLPLADLAPDKVTAADRAAVSGQRIRRLDL